MNRLWSRVGVRVTSVGLLVAGAAGGIYVGQDRGDAPQQTSEAKSVVQVDVDEMQLLKQRQGEHAAARAYQRQAEGDAAEKAAAAAKAAAGKAHELEVKVVAEKRAEAAKKKAKESAATGGPVAYDGPIPASCAEFSGSREIGCSLMLDAGFAISQFPCLDKLWTKESHWNYKAENTSSGAYGIPQALPGSKMASEGSDWKTNPATQIKWGLGYIKGRYGTPCSAWSHSQDTGWY